MNWEQKTHKNNEDNVLSRSYNQVYMTTSSGPLSVSVTHFPQIETNTKLKQEL